MKFNGHRQKLRRREVLMMEQCWFLLLVVHYAPSVLICTLEVDTKVITIDKHMDLIIVIWSIIILYEHNSDETE